MIDLHSDYVLLDIVVVDLAMLYNVFYFHTLLYMIVLEDDIGRGYPIHGYLREC